jgi:hypothetical protein
MTNDEIQMTRESRTDRAERRSLPKMSFGKFCLVTWLIGMLALPGPARAANKYVLTGNGTAYANNGNGPDASNVSNKPYKDLKQAIRTNAVAGDHLYVGPGIYRETIIFLITLTSLYTIEGDPLNMLGFKDSSGVLVPPGAVVVTARTTSDTTTGAGVAVLDVSGINNVLFKNLYIEGDFGHPGIHAYSSSTNIQCEGVFIKCGGNGGYCFDASVGNLVIPYFAFRRCTFKTSGNSSANCISIIYSSASSGADWDSGSSASDSIFITTSDTVIGYLRSNGLSKVMGGMALTNNYISGAYGIATDNSSTTKPWILRGNYIEGGAQSIANQSTGQIDSDYNNYVYGSSLGGGTVTKGAHDRDKDMSFRHDLGSSRGFGLGDQPFHSLLAGDGEIGATGNFTATDSYNLARPNPNSIGALEKYVPPGRGY